MIMIAEELSVHKSIEAPDVDAFEPFFGDRSSLAALAST